MLLRVLLCSWLELLQELLPFLVTYARSWALQQKLLLTKRFVLQAFPKFALELVLKEYAEHIVHIRIVERQQGVQLLRISMRA
jgi:hypothetical protein